MRLEHVARQVTLHHHGANTFFDVVRRDGELPHALGRMFIRVETHLVSGLERLGALRFRV